MVDNDETAHDTYPEKIKCLKQAADYPRALLN
jgi:hypothetical protein